VSGAAFLRLKKLKGGGIIAAAARHNRRALQAEVGASQSIDATRSTLNETLRGPPTPEDVAMLAKALMRAAGITKTRKDAVLGIEIVFSLPADHQIDDRAYFDSCSRWADEHFGGAQNIVSVDIHRDESAPHCHVLLVPIINGRMTGSDIVGNRIRLRELQQDFHTKVGSRYGLAKAPGRLAGRGKANAAAGVLEKLRASSDAVLRSGIWPTVRDVIERDPAPFAVALGVDIQVPKKKLRSMKDIFISKGKGPSREPKPIGFAPRPERRSLCSVGFATAPPSLHAPPDVHEAQAVISTPVLVEDSIVVREEEIDASWFDSESGEFIAPEQASGATTLDRQRRI
jgi:hypothetical protein